MWWKQKSACSGNIYPDTNNEHVAETLEKMLNNVTI